MATFTNSVFFTSAFVRAYFYPSPKASLVSTASFVICGIGPVLFNADQRKLPECSVCNVLQNVELTLFLQYDCYPWCETPFEICQLSGQDKNTDDTVTCSECYRFYLRYHFLL